MRFFLESSTSSSWTHQPFNFLHRSGCTLSSVDFNFNLLEFFNFYFSLSPNYYFFSHQWCMMTYLLPQSILLFLCCPSLYAMSLKTDVSVIVVASVCFAFIFTSFLFSLLSSLHGLIFVAELICVKLSQWVETDRL